MPELSYNRVLQWVELVDGNTTFTNRQIWDELNIKTTTAKSNLRVYLKTMADAGIITRTNSHGTFRKIDVNKEVMNWREAMPENIVSLHWPFGIEKYASIYPRNVVLLAGTKQQGKSTYLYNFIKLNMYNYDIELFNSETGEEQMKARFTDLGIPLDAPFEVYRRFDNFADVVNPDNISVIDYLDFNSEFYLAGAEIDAIFRKKRNGIAIIAMHIPPPSVVYVKGVRKVIDRDYAYGGGSTAKRAFIYLSMGSHKLKIKHAKKPAQKKVNPENITWSYSFDENGQFTNIQRYYGDDTREFI